MMGGLGLLACVVGLGLTLLVLGGLVALVVWMLQKGEGGARLPSSAGVNPAGVLGTVEAPASLPASPPSCPNCGQPVQVGWSHCAYCGAPQERAG
ncbi:MAG: zinc ribbon domain-containing protein [Actinomycetota bacterium]